MMRRSLAAITALSPNDKKGLVLALLITLLGLGLRLCGLAWGLPDARHPLATYHPDELINLNAALTADIPHFQLDIGFYNYGAFYFYLVNLAHTYGRVFGAIPSSTAGATEFAERAALFLAGRLVTALLGTLTILAIYFLGRRLFGRKVGLLGALLYAVTPLAVLHSHFLTVDVPSTFFVVMALLWAVRLLERQTWADYVLAGVWVGLASATKYTTALVLIAPLLAHRYNLPPNACRKHRMAHLFVLLVAVGFTFIIACPGPLLNWDVFWNGTYPGSGLRYELLEHSRTGHGDLFLSTGFGGWYHLVVSLRFGMGSLLLLVALMGVGYACKKRTAGDKILFAFLLLTYLSATFSAVRFARYMIPILPVLCLFAARWVWSIRAKSPFVVQGVAALAALAPLACSLQYALTMREPDPRDRVADALEQKAKQGASIAFAKIPWFFSPPLSPLFGMPAAPQRRKAVDQTTRYQLKIASNEWDKSLLEPAPDFVVVSNLETMHAVTRLQLTEPTQFMGAVTQNYSAQVFSPRFFESTATSALIPEDILYVIPTLTLYEKR
jgi:4-amino-4-deoxy-L-arabinose transferase-like glycosyltransferase